MGHRWPYDISHPTHTICTHWDANTQMHSQIYNTSRTNKNIPLELMWFLHDKTCNAYSGPLFWRCERAVFMWSAETLDCNAWASNIPLLSLFIYTSITVQLGPSSLHGGKAAQAFMAEHICGVLWGNRGHNTWAKWACLELWIPVVFNWMMRTSRSWSFPMWTALRN